MAGGRPSKYKEEFVVQAEKLTKLGATDAELADFFSEYRSEDQFLAFWLWMHRQDRNGVIALQKRKANEAKRRIRSNPSQRLLNATRARLWAALKGRTDRRLFSRLGYSINELMSSLESKFTDGMNWRNYGSWHVDHIKPCALFNQNDPSQFAECWALTNLQPLWASDNVKKGARYGAA